MAVEPNPIAILLLQKNLAANNILHRLEIVCAGIESQDGSSFLEFSDRGSWGDRIAMHRDQRKKGVQVHTLTVSTILRGRKPNLVKCNAEGAEFELFPQLFSMGVKPEFVILMVHPEYGSADDLLDLFRTEGYYIQDAGSTKKRIRVHCWLAASQRGRS
jgi:FkbM family methyltransferase